MISNRRAWSAAVVVVAAAGVATAHAATHTYYYNQVTQESRWDDPNHLAPYEDEQGRKYWVDAATGESTYETPCEWYQTTSEDHDDRVYYVHKETEETSWDQPECLAWVRVDPDYDEDVRQRAAAADNEDPGDVGDFSGDVDVDLLPSDADDIEV